MLILKKLNFNIALLKGLFIHYWIHFQVTINEQHAWQVEEEAREEIEA